MNKKPKFIYLQKYSYEQVEKIAIAHKLFVKIDGSLFPFEEDVEELDGGIGEAFLPLYDEDDDVVASFILSMYATTSYWRCIYVSSRFSEDKKEHV